ncbi:MAG: SWIB/MDM2 domain-containing protein [Chlamydiota bacterium]
MAKKKAKKAVRRAAPKKKTVKKAVRKAAAPKRKAAPKKKKTTGKRKSALNQTAYGVSADLEAVIGAKKATRPEIVKKLWAYIKAHKCQDTKNRRMIVPDKKLSCVIGSKPVDMLKLAGCLNKHIK